MAQQKNLELAKQGNPQAIAALMNRSLQPKGITAKAAIKDGFLQVMLESAQVPNQQAMIPFVRKGITRLGADLIERVKVYGRQTGEDFPAWIQTFDLEINGILGSSPTQQATLSNTEIATKTLLESSSTDAEIQQALQNALNKCNLLVQVNRKNAKVIVLINREASNYVNYSQVTQIIKKKLSEFRLKDIETIEVLGKIGDSKTLEFQRFLEPTFDVILENIYPFYTTKVVRELMVTNLLKEVEAANLINSLPTVIKAKVSKQEAETQKKNLRN